MQTSRQLIFHSTSQLLHQINSWSQSKLGTLCGGSRAISFNSLFKGWSSHCCEDECQKSLAQIRRGRKYVVEKSCKPSIFESWKPKIPDLTPVNFPTIQKSMMKPFELKTCSVGMKFKDKTCGQIAAEVKNKQKMFHPKWITACPPIKDKSLLGPLPPARECVKQCKDPKDKTGVGKSCRKECDPKVPEGDWDVDAH